MTAGAGITERYREILRRIESARARSPDRQVVTVVAVSKLQPVGAIRELYRAGHRDFGENYVQELVAKARELQAEGLADIRWHLIGHLQSNKARQAIQSAACVHTVDSEALAGELARRWAQAGRPGRLPVFLQVNVDAEASKSGVAPSEVVALARILSGFPQLELLGLMCIPSADRTREARGVRAALEKMRELRASCGSLTGGMLSMGMSEDFEAAIECGATHVRIGSALFGPRASR